MSRICSTRQILVSVGSPVSKRLKIYPTCLRVQIVDLRNSLIYLAILNRVPDIHSVFNRLQFHGWLESRLLSKLFRRVFVAFNDEIIHYELVQVLLIDLDICQTLLPFVSRDSLFSIRSRRCRFLESTRCFRDGRGTEPSAPVLSICLS